MFLFSIPIPSPLIDTEPILEWQILMKKTGPLLIFGLPNVSIVYRYNLQKFVLLHRCKIISADQTLLCRRIKKIDYKNSSD